MKFHHVLRVALWCAIAFALTMAWLPKPPHVPLEQLGDKFQHMLAFATISLLAALAYPHFPLTRIGERLSLMGAVIELVQAIPAIHRDRDIMDWIADTVMVVIVLGIVGLIRHTRRVEPSAD